MSEATLSKAKEYVSSSYKRIAIVGGLFLVSGIGMGIAAESNTNEVATGKAITARTCLEMHAHEDVVTEEMDDCFDAGFPIGYIDSYIEAQENEAESIEIGRLAIWSVVPIAATAFYVTTL